MKTNEEIRQEILEEAMDRLKKEASSVVEGIMSSLYTDYLPHVVSDTDSNIAFRVTGCVNNLIAGKFEKASCGSGRQYVSVSDGYGVDHWIDLNHYGSLVEPLCKFMGETIQNERIKQLENEIEFLKQSIASRGRY